MNSESNPKSKSESRRSFIRNSMILSIVAAQPTILAGLIRANGGGQPAGTEPKTSFPDTTYPTTTVPFTTFPQTTVSGTETGGYYYY